MDGRAGPLQLLLLLVAAVVGIVVPALAAHTPTLAAHTPTLAAHTPTCHHPILNDSSEMATSESHWLDRSMATLPSVVTMATSGSYGMGNSLATHPAPAERSKRHVDPLQLPGERRARKSKKRKKRRRQKKRKRKRTKLLRAGGSKRQQHGHHGAQTSSSHDTSSSTQASASSHTSALITPWKYHKTRLVELLTGGNDHFLVRDPKASTPPKQSRGGASDGGSRLPRRNARRFVLPLEIVSSEALTWVPYNPNIRVSIQVIDEGVDGETDHRPSRPLGSDERSSKHPHHQQQHNKPQVIFPGGLGSEVYTSRTLGVEGSTRNTPSQHSPPNIITSAAKDGQNQASKERPRQLDGKKQKTGDKKGRGKHRRKLERENGGGEKGEEKSRIGDYKEWGRRENARDMRKGGKSEDDRSERRREKDGEGRGKEKKGGQTRKGEERQPGWPQDLVQGLAEDLERLLSTDRQGTQDPTTAAAGEDPCTSWSTCRVEGALQELANLPSLPTCPCLYPADLPYRHDLYDSLHRRSFRWVGVSGERERIDVYHRGAHSCIRSRVTTKSLAAQTCCYDRERKLLTRGSGAGSPALVSPQVNFALHWQVDVLPWLACRGNFLRYQAVRPPNNDQKCPTNPDNHKYQQQVYMATDY